MSKSVVTIFLIVVIFLISCEPGVTFIEPQPESIKSSTSFSKQIQGSYLAFDFASVLTINEKQITRHFDFDYKTQKDSLGINFKIVKDSIVNLVNGSKEKVLIQVDSIVQHANWIDTLFNISSENVLKNYKGYYFLNSKFSDEKWEVKELGLKNGVLTLASISTKEDIQKLNEIMESPNDTVSTNFNLTKRQFKRFLREEGFREKETFTRMKKVR